MGKRRKTRTHLKGPNNSAATSTNAPKSFVIKSGNVSRSVSALVQDVRTVMEPNTATRLKERKSNKLKDFLAMAGPLGVSHMIIFGQTDAGINMRIARCPRGPTVTFRINKYALAKDLFKASRRPRAPGSEFTTPPLLVLNNFGGEEKHIKLLVTVFQNLFPPIHVQTMRLSQARRIVLLNYNAASRTIDWRHYIISVRPVGVSRAVRRVIEGTTGRNGTSGASSVAAASSAGSEAGVSTARKRGKALVNLATAADISEYVLGRVARSSSTTPSGGGFDTDGSDAESDAEDARDERNAVALPQAYLGRGNDAESQRAVRLREVGPRLELRLVKIEEGMSGGEVLYHETVKKTPAEIAAQKRELNERQAGIVARRAEQERNVERKKAAKDALKPKVTAKAPGAEDDDEDEREDAAEAEEQLSPLEDEDQDEFEYEDRFGPTGGEGEDEELFDDAEEPSGAEDASDMEEEEEYQGSDDEDDLSPIELGALKEVESSDEDEGVDQKAPERKKARGAPVGARTSGQGRVGRGAGRGAGQSRGRAGAGGRGRGAKRGARR